MPSLGPSPALSVVICTFNSGKLLGDALQSIRNQDFPAQDLEILIIDGGSTDDTLDLARKAGCRIENNPWVEPVRGKHLGFHKARGRFIIYLDHDERLLDKSSLARKVRLLRGNEGVRVVVPSGYVTPPGAGFISHYINAFGDPFSAYYYRQSRLDGELVTSLRRRDHSARKSADAWVFSPSLDNAPLMETCAGAIAADRHWILEQLPDMAADPMMVPQYFYGVIGRGGRYAVLEDDGILHQSTTRLGPYLSKIQWRIRNNVYFSDHMGQAGFTGRLWFGRSMLARLKAPLFIVYSLALLPVSLDALFRSVQKADPRWLAHILLSIYTACAILYHHVAKALGHRPPLALYDGSARPPQNSHAASREAPRLEGHDWESRFFQVKTAKLQVSSASRASLEKALIDAKAQGFRVVHWDVPQAEEASAAAARSLASYAEERVHLTAPVGLAEPAPRWDITDARGNEPTEELLNLAVSCGTHSRYRRDSRYGAAAAEKLYREWLARSLDGTLADAVLIARAGGRALGLITLKKEAHLAHIGLFGVSSRFRGRAVGGALLGAALAWAEKHGCSRLTVTTQAQNRLGMRFYTSHGFKITDIHRFFHFWVS